MAQNLLAQVEALYAERQELLDEVGSESAVAVIQRERMMRENLLAQVESLYQERQEQKDDRSSLESQVRSMKADRERLERALGSHDPLELISKFNSLREQQSKPSTIRRIFG
jgi:hypothetical protein